VKRAAGSFESYIRNASPDYLGWPPGAAKPQRGEALPQRARASPRRTRELTMSWWDFAINGDTAVIYYKTHRSAAGGWDHGG